MNAEHSSQPLRWLLLVWVGLVYLMALSSVIQVNPKGGCLVATCSGLTLSDVRLLVLGLFTLLLLLYGGLLWLGLAGAVPVQFYWLYFLFQGGLVLVLGLIVQQQNVVLSLALALTLGAISMLKRVHETALVVGGALLLILLSGLINSGAPVLHDWRALSSTFVALFWTKTDYPALLLFVVGYLVVYIQHTRAHAALTATHHELEAAHRQLQVSAEQIEALTVLTERQRLARELHDTLAQGLAGVVMQLQVADAYQREQQHVRAQTIVQQALGLAQTALQEARQAIDNLRSTPPKNADLTQSIHEEIEHFTAATGIPCEADLAGLGAIPVPLGEQVRRMVVESLTNVARHARASQVWVQARNEAGKIKIELRDDGVGFEPTRMETLTGHYGLLGLEERARLCEGTLVIQSARGAGTTIRLCLPVELEEAPR
jgi:two-component system, NarL family, sensor histidine kinase YdfH